MNTRAQDIKALLLRAQSDVEELAKQSASGQIDRITLKNTLENLRSSLDYVAQDIAAELKRRAPTEGMPLIIYFPYGRDREKFTYSVKRNLPTVVRDAPALYGVIEGAQPFISGDPWLTDLCELTNSVKHNELTKTTTKRFAGINVPGFGRMSGENISFRGNVFGDLRLPMDDVFIRTNGEIDVIPGEVPVEVTRDNQILFHERKLPVAPFTAHCTKRLNELVTAIYKLL